MPPVLRTVVVLLAGKDGEEERATEEVVTVTVLTWRLLGQKLLAKVSYARVSSGAQVAAMALRTC